LTARKTLSSISRSTRRKVDPHPKAPLNHSVTESRDQQNAEFALLFGIGGISI
jgi:hypothetical protein